MNKTTKTQAMNSKITEALSGYVPPTRAPINQLANDTYWAIESIRYCILAQDFKGAADRMREIQEKCERAGLD